MHFANEDALRAKGPATSNTQGGARASLALGWLVCAPLVLAPDALLSASHALVGLTSLAWLLGVRRSRTARGLSEGQEDNGQTTVRPPWIAASVSTL